MPFLRISLRPGALSIGGNPLGTLVENDVNLKLDLPFSADLKR